MEHDVHAMITLPEVNNAMSFLTKSNIIAGPNNSPGNLAKWFFQNITIGVNGDIINNDETKTEEIIQHLVLYMQVRKTTKYSMVQQVKWMSS